MPRILQFGETIDGYAVPVINERAVRASAGLLFAFALVSFMNAWLIGNFRPTRVFVVAFLADFTIRVFVNPRYAPTLVIGQWIVGRQQPEYVGAAQKRFAWAIGFVLAAAMSYLVVLRHVVGPLNLFVCGACMLLLFFESAFGICIGCRVHEWFARKPAQLCPGGVCATDAPRNAPLGWGRAALALGFIALMAGVAPRVAGDGPPQPAAVAAPAPTSTPAAAPSAADAAEEERCRVPEFARQMGHEQIWKLHNNCK